MDHLSFREFVGFLARSPAKKAGAPPVAASKAAAPPVAADDATAPPVVVDGAAAPPVEVNESAASPKVTLNGEGSNASSTNNAQKGAACS